MKILLLGLPTFTYYFQTCYLKKLSLDSQDFIALVVNELNRSNEGRNAGIVMTAQNQSIRRKTNSSSTLLIIKPSWDGLESKAGFRRERPATES